MCEKLEQIGFSMNAVSFIEVFLTNRIQRACVNGTKSEWLNIKQGVPQGTILGPLLFLLHVNDMTNNCKTNTERIQRRRRHTIFRSR